MSFALDMLPPTTVPIAPITTTSISVHAPSDPPQETKPPPSPLPDVFLVIGVKSRVLRGVEARRAIRETWAAPVSTAPLGVRVVFLGCEPDLSMLATADKTAAQHTIAMEKATHQDFWTHELQCLDSFFTLVDKDVAFLDMALTTFPTLAYAMIVDDDAYVRPDRLVALLRSDRVPNTRFYGGNVAEEKQFQPTRPVRIPESRYYLPFEMYPIAEFPPFVAGAHFVLSTDIVQFIARNRRDLRGLKGLDDATMAVWMLALQITPKFLPEFQIVRSWKCTESLVSYADLGPAAIRLVHSNLVHNRAFCAGFNRTQWLKQYDTVDFDDDDTNAKADVQFNWDLEVDFGTLQLQIPTTITIANQSVALLYVPASATYSAAFCNHVLPLLEARLSILVGTNFCRFHRKILLQFLTDHDATMPSLRPLLTLARHNLERDAVDDKADRTKSILYVHMVAPTTSHSARVLVECLMVAAYPDKHIVVMPDSCDPPKSQRPHIVVVVGAVDTTRFNDANVKLLVLSTNGGLPVIPESDQRLVVIRSDLTTTTHARQLYVPQVSMAFAGAIRHTPMDLLQLVDSTTAEPRSIAAVVLHRCGLAAHEEAMRKQLNDVDHVKVFARDPCTDAPTEDPVSSIPTDDVIDRYRSFKFIVAMGDDALASTSGFVSETIAMAFIAGSIPVYTGHAEAVNHLFNTKAFIDCRSFATLMDCGDYVVKVHDSTALYERLRSAPPVANATAFLEAFSWHPHVAALATRDEEVLLVGHRLQQLLRDA